MVAPESIKALHLFPACTVMVGQSVIHATVVASSAGGPPNSWGTLLREGSPSLKLFSESLESSELKWSDEGSSIVTLLCLTS